MGSANFKLPPDQASPTFAHISTGTSASVSSTAIGNTAIVGKTTFGAVQQIAKNEGVVEVSTSRLTSGAISGTAASVGVGATGVAASVSVSAINNAGAISGTGFGIIQQSVENKAAGTVDVKSTTVNIAGISGTAGSASISARGASASVGISEIGGPVGASMGSITSGSIQQQAVNAGTVTIDSGSSIVSTGGLSGTASSASIAATGASANFSLASIASASVVNPVGISGISGSITQTATNNATVVNKGSITLAGALGTAASAGISATGASAGISMTSIK